MKIQAVTEDYTKNVAQLRELLGRLHKGQRVLETAYKDKSITTAFQAMILFNKISEEAFTLLEECLFIHEYLSMGKTVVLKRNGKAVNTSPLVEKGEIEIDPWTLQTIVALKQTFGDDFKDMIEFRDLER